MTTNRTLSIRTLSLWARVGHAWLLLGALLLVLSPAMRGQHWLIGWLPFWLVVAPLLVLLQVDALRGFERARRWRRRLMRRARRVPVQARRRVMLRAA